MSVSIPGEIAFHQGKLPDSPSVMTFVVAFAVRPQINDVIEVDQYSIKQLPREELHLMRWQVFDVRHVVVLEAEERDDKATGLTVKTDPLVRLRVAVAPLESQ